MARRLFIAVAALILGCEGSRGSAPEPDVALPAPDAEEPEPDAASPPNPDGGCPGEEPESAREVEPGLWRELIEIPGVLAPPNERTNEETPAELNSVRVLRYRPTGEPPPEVRAVIVAMPGFLAGASGFDPLSRALVRRGIADGVPVEVLAIDRRSNRLEDRRGIDAARAAADPEIAAGYYYSGKTIDGTPFAGTLARTAPSYMSEWGLAVHVGDAHAVISMARETSDHVFLMGHSLGSTFAEIYAGWRFEDGHRGQDDLAGLILIDGAPALPGPDETAWLEGSSFAGFLRLPGIEELRSSGPYFTELPLLGAGAFYGAEILALRAMNAPEDVVEDPIRDRSLGLLLSLPAGEVPAMTNAAAIAFGFDDRYMPLSFARVGLGEATGGAVELYSSALAGGEELQRPADPGATYGWVDALDTEPPEYTPLALLYDALLSGGVDLFEWYFPTRLAIDVQVAGGANLPEDGWQAAAGFRATDGAMNGAPILSIAGGLFPVAAMQAITERVAPEVGGGRPQAGASRGDKNGFELVDATHLAHLDVVTAKDGGENPIPAAITDFVRRNLP